MYSQFKVEIIECCINTIWIIFLTSQQNVTTDHDPWTHNYVHVWRSIVLIDTHIDLQDVIT